MSSVSRDKSSTKNSSGYAQKVSWIPDADDYDTGSIPDEAME